MVRLQTLLELINAHKNRVLLVAQAALPEQQFKAYKTFFLNEFGEKGLEGKLARLYAENRQRDGQGMGGNIHAGKEVPP